MSTMYELWNVTHPTRAHRVSWNSSAIFTIWGSSSLSMLCRSDCSLKRHFPFYNILFRCEVVRNLSQIGPPNFFGGSGPKFLTQFYKFGSPSNVKWWRSRATQEHRRTSRLIGDFVQVQILGVTGPKSKIKEKFCRVPHGELTAKKWLDSIEKQKKKNRLEEAVWQTYRQKIIDS